MWLNGELAQLSVSYEDLRQAGEDKDVVIHDLQQAAETTRAALETEKKQVEGKLLFPLSLVGQVHLEIRSRLSSCSCFRSYGWLSGRQQPKRRRSRRPTTPPSKS
jgi:hypothetical protein